MKTPFFSIITCTYNSEKYLEKNILSVENQNYENFEHIFIDGFSTDETVKMIKKYQEKYPKQVKFFQFKARGISNAMNHGIEKSSGEYLIHLHSDDCFYDNKVLEDVTNFLTQNNFPDWIFGKELHITNEKELGIYPKFKIYKQDSKSLYSNYILDLINYIRHQTVFIKRSVFMKHGLFRENLKCSMDVEMWLRLKSVTNWLYFDRLIAIFRHHEEAQSTGKKNLVNNRKESYDIHREYLSNFQFLIFKIINNLLKLKNKIKKS